MEIFVKEYLNEQGIKTVEGLAQHIIELKRNTVVPKIVFELVDVLVNDKGCLLSFFAENKESESKKQPVFLKDDFRLIDLWAIEKPLGEDLEHWLDNSYLNQTSNTLEEAHQEWQDRWTKNMTGDFEPRPFDFNDINKARQEKVKIVLDDMVGKKESQTVEKAPIFTYCKVNKNAIEALSLRALHGHIKYEKPNDWENFTRVPNADFEYSNSQFRHALDIGEEDEETHLIASAWNSVARLELYLRNKVK